jgi:diguanylate cyclase (GGDEF)-like protein
MVGRYGGEEFLVILNNCDPLSAMLRAENLRSAISCKPVQTHSLRVPVTISIGVAMSIDFVKHEVDEII